MAEYEIESGYTPRKFRFKSVEHYQAAVRWYKSVSQAEAIAWAEQRGIKLHAEDGSLDPDWTDITLQEWAECHAEQALRERDEANARRARAFQPHEVVLRGSPHLRRDPSGIKNSW